MSWIDISIFCTYLLAMLGVGFYFMYRNASTEDYYVGGRKLSSVHIGLSVVATDVGGGFSIGLGGLGFANSANIGENCAIFEPTHGSAPKYENLNPSIVNPIAMILSSCLMLEYLNETEKAQRIRKAISDVIAEGKVRTYDMLRLVGGPDVIKKGAASTPEMTDTIIAKL